MSPEMTSPSSFSDESNEHDHFQRLGELAEQIQECYRAGEEPNIKELVAGDAELELEIRQLLPSLRALNDLGCSAANEAGTLEPPMTIQHLGTLGDYRIFREIGRGGMGVVYEAEQISLGRRVALKVLPFASVLDSRRLKRFQNEALAAAHLDHPHIVDVYGVGCDRSVHFYAMRYIEGRTLADAISQLQNWQQDDALSSIEELLQRVASPLEPSSSHGAANHDSKPTGRPVAASDLATQPSGVPQMYESMGRLAMHVAEALQAAHEEGIVHRDIKPSNLMLDARGKVWITDFGLAATEGDHGITMSGDLLGTLRYMSPEQALAQRVRIDGRTDIYSLGVTLYELLTLQPAVQGEGRAEILRQITFESPPTVRRINPAVPADLVLIVAKAMEKNPEDRYQTAGEMAEDLRRFIERRPVQAQAVGWLQYASRWMRRHHRIAAIGAIVALLYMVGSGIAGTVIWRTRQDALQQKLRAEAESVIANEQRDTADRLQQEAEQRREQVIANYHAAMNAFRAIESSVRNEPQLLLPELLNTRRQLLIKAQTAYKDFLGSGGEDPEVLVGRRGAYRELSTISAELGDLKGAIDHLYASQQIAEQLLTIEPGNVSHLDAINTIQGELAQRLSDSGKHVQAEKVLVQALDGIAKLRLMDPQSNRYQRRSAVYRKYQGINHYSLGHYQESRDAFQDALYSIDAILRTSDDIQLQFDRLACLSNLGAVQGKLGEPTAATELLEKLVATCEDMASREEASGRTQLWMTWGASLQNLAATALQMDQPTKALEALERADVVWRKGLDQFPARFEFRREEAKAVLFRGQVLIAMSKFSDAEAVYRHGIELRKTLALELVEDPTCHEEWAASVIGMASLLLEQGRLDEAAAMFEQSTEMQVAAPTAEAQDRRAMWLQNLAVAFAEAERWDDCLACFQESIDVRESLMQQFPDDLRIAVRQAEVIGNLGLTFYHRQQWPAAIGKFQDAIGRLRRIQEQGNGPVEVMSMLQRFENLLKLVNNKQE